MLPETSTTRIRLNEAVLVDYWENRFFTDELIRRTAAVAVIRAAALAIGLMMIGTAVNAGEVLIREAENFPPAGSFVKGASDRSAIPAGLVTRPAAPRSFDWDRDHARQDACREKDRIVEVCSRGYCDELALRQAQRLLGLPAVKNLALTDDENLALVAELRRVIAEGKSR